MRILLLIAALLATIHGFATECERAYLDMIGRDPELINSQSVYSGKFLNDLGEYARCTSNDRFRYLLARFNITQRIIQQDISDSFSNFVTGLCVPNE